MRLLLIVISLFAAGCAQYRPVDAFVIGLTPAEGGALEQRVRIDLRIQNPNDRALSVRGMRIELDLNGQPLARGVSDTHFAIPALGEATTSIVTSTSLFDLARQAATLPGRATMDYDLSGELFVDSLSGGVKFHHRGRFGGVNPDTPRALQ
jgi:LEA14-like dessication related protein